MMSRQTILLLLLLPLAPSLLHAQEHQVSIDATGTIMRIDAEMESRLQLFKDVAGFEEAILFQSVDSSYSLEIYSTRDGVRQRARRLMSPAEGRTFRQSVSDRLAAISPRDLIDQSGRTGLLVGTTALGLTYYGVAVPIASKVDDFKVGFGLYMLTAASSFFVPFFATRNSVVTEPQSGLTTYGGIKGISDGMFLYGLLAGSEGFEDDASGPLWSGFTVGITEAIVGFVVAREMDGPHVRLVTTGGVLGNGVGLGAAYLIDFDDFRGYAALMLAGTAGGYVTTNALYNTGHYTEGDASVLATTTFGSAYVPVGILHLAGVDDERTLVAGSIGGALAGMYLGHRIAVGHDFTNSRGTLMGVGTVAMGLLGAGIGYLVSPDNDEDALRLAGGGGAIGTIAGFGLMYGLVGNEAEHGDTGSRWSVEVNAASLLALGEHGSSLPSGMFLPVISVTGCW